MKDPDELLNPKKKPAPPPKPKGGIVGWLTGMKHDKGYNPKPGLVRVPSNISQTNTASIPPVPEDRRIHSPSPRQRVAATAAAPLAQSGQPSQPAASPAQAAQPDNRFKYAKEAWRENQAALQELDKRGDNAGAVIGQGIRGGLDLAMGVGADVAKAAYDFAKPLVVGGADLASQAVTGAPVSLSLIHI